MKVRPEGGWGTESGKGETSRVAVGAEVGLVVRVEGTRVVGARVGVGVGRESRVRVGSTVRKDMAWRVGDLVVGWRSGGLDSARAVVGLVAGEVAMCWRQGELYISAAHFKNWGMAERQMWRRRLKG